MKFGLHIVLRRASVSAGGLPAGMSAWEVCFFFKLNSHYCDLLRGEPLDAITLRRRAARRQVGGAGLV